MAFTYFKVKSTKCLCLLPVVLANSYEFRLVYIIAENTAGDNTFSSFCCCALTAGDRVAGGRASPTDRPNGEHGRTAPSPLPDPPQAKAGEAYKTAAVL